MLLGIVQADGTVSHASSVIRIDREFVEIARAGRPPERRFRFASTCVKGACARWTGSQCGVIVGILKDIGNKGSPGNRQLPACSIRPQCRWYREHGGAACGVCPEVITDLRDDQIS